jgi:uncharacterized membrane protein
MIMAWMNSAWKARLRNYGFWLSVAALIPLILQAFGINFLPANYDQIVNTLLWLLVLLGVINNPTDGKGFGDTYAAQLALKMNPALMRLVTALETRLGIEQGSDVDTVIDKVVDVLKMRLAAEAAVIDAKAKEITSSGTGSTPSDVGTSATT